MKLLNEFPVDWPVPSDHLPAAVELTMKGASIRLVTWNVLNDMWFPDRAPPPLLPREQREDVVMEVLARLFERGADIVCLQECGRRLTDRVLCERRQYRAILGTRFPSSDQELMLFAPHRVRIDQSRRKATKLYDVIGAAPHAIHMQRFIHVAGAEECRFDLVNTHVPSSLNRSSRGGCRQLLDFVARETIPGLPVVVCGDFNVETRFAGDLLCDRELPRFQIPRGGYRTFVDVTTLEWRDIDYFLVDPGIDGDVQSCFRISAVEEVLGSRGSTGPNA
ncbi:MAG: endonuclease/exonuclease/phosphatase family protein [Planctomycetota bacterium]